MPTNADLIHNIGLVHLAMGNIDEAMTQFDRAIALAPKKMRFWLNRGRAYARQGNYEMALRDFEAAERIARDHPEAKTCTAVARAAAEAQRRGARVAPLPQQCIADPAVRTTRSHHGSRRRIA
jgi:tetratricopeptide (TPR) repeat protein